MKLANVTPAHKKGNRSEKGNLGPVNILHNLSKAFERCIYNQIAQCFDEILAKHQCSSKQGRNVQHCLTVLLEILKDSVDQGRFRGFTNQSFDCLQHNLLTY